LLADHDGKRYTASHLTNTSAMKTATIAGHRATLRRFLLIFVLCLSIGPATAQMPTLGPGLQQALDSALPLERISVIVTFHGEGGLTDAQLGALNNLGIDVGIHFAALPIAGLLATPTQVHALMALDGVRSIWPNEQLEYYNHDARHLTGVERMRTDSRFRNAMGIPYSGKGIGVVVNDSGVDGALPDVQFGKNLVENVQALTNLHAVSTLLPVTYLEGQINTDLGSGHGTHVAGTVGGTGVSSGGKHAGMAPGADLIGYGSGAVLLILDGIGAFDYAITNQYRFNIRVVTNSWGSSGTFNPDHPINVATYETYRRGMTVLFAAGNEGPGEGTHNPYAVAPWVISVGAGEKNGTLAGFSSRGMRGDSGNFATSIDSRQWTYVNEPTIVAPGVDIISARATTSALAALVADQDLTELGANAAFYSHMSGTSMATPVVAGIVALMLEANPQLQPDDVKSILQKTATNMPGHESWEVGAGYVNAYAAVAMAAGKRSDFGATVNASRSFNSNALLGETSTQPFSINFSPLGTTETKTFEVGEDVAWVTARAVVPDNTVAVVITDPDGERYGSSITLPLLGSTAVVSAPGKPGTWQITVRGIGSVSGVSLDPLGVTNGTGLPGTVSGSIRFLHSAGFSGLNDIDGHEAAGAIQYAVSNRLVDGNANGNFHPDDVLNRGSLAEFLVMGAAVRQHLPVDGSWTFGDVPASLRPFAEAVSARGAALKDRFHQFNGVMRAGNAFRPSDAVNRAELAYSLVQSLGLQDLAESHSGNVTVRYNDQRITLEDASKIPTELRGYVQLALDLHMMNAHFSIHQGRFDLFPTVKAHFKPLEAVTRADYAVTIGRFHDSYRSGFSLQGYGGDSQSSILGGLAGLGEVDEGTELPESIHLDQNYPNPFNPSTTIRFTLPEASNVSITVFDMLGRSVRTLIDGRAMEAGAHEVAFDANDLASGTYLYRMDAGATTITRQMTLVK
jgi:serine protease AprX